MQPHETICEGNFRDEASLPNDAESMEVNPGQMFSQRVTSENEFILKPCTDKYSESPPYASDQSSAQPSNYSSTENGGPEFPCDVITENGETQHTPCQFTSDTETISNNTMTTRVLLGLDNGLREKVDVHVDAFRDTLNALLDDQFHRIKHLIRFSADLDSGETKTKVPDQIENDKCKDIVTQCEEEDDKMNREADRAKSELLLQICTYANVITNTLVRRQEFKIT